MESPKGLLVTLVRVDPVACRETLGTVANLGCPGNPAPRRLEEASQAVLVPQDFQGRVERREMPALLAPDCPVFLDSTDLLVSQGFLGPRAFLDN